MNQLLFNANTVKINLILLLAYAEKINVNFGLFAHHQDTSNRWRCTLH